MRRKKALSLLLSLAVTLYAPFAALAADWPTYLYNPSRDSANTGENTISTGNASSLHQLWAFHTGGTIASQAVVSNGTLYDGSWDGNEYALNANTGQQEWKAFLDTSPSSQCGTGPTIGITSSAAVDNGNLYVGGGGDYWYALNASTGQQEWKVYTGDSSASGGHYNWSSPLIYNGSAYFGIASQCDDPIVQGQLFKVDLSSHQASTFDIEPSGQAGAGVWTSPSVDPSSGTIYFDTGNGNGGSSYEQSMVAVDASSLSVKGSWKVPAGQSFGNDDWSTTPVMSILGDGMHIVTAINKNGILYAFDAGNISKGPLWQDTLSTAGECPECGQGSISSGAFDGAHLFYAAGNTTINGTSYKGSVQSIDPYTGNIVWRVGLPDVPFSAVAYSNGILVVPAGNTLEVLDANTGNVLWSQALDSIIYGAPSIADGQIFAGTTNGTIYAFGPQQSSGGGTGNGGGTGGTGTKLGGLDLGAYCYSRGKGGAELNGNTWSCSGGGNIDMTGACVWQYGDQNAVANQDDPNSPYSWNCYNTGSSTKNRLGGLDLGAYCQAQGQGGAVLDNGTWSCSGGGNIDMTGACVWQYDTQNATAQEDSPGDPYTWDCYSSSSPQTLGGLNLNGYCQSLGQSGVALSDNGYWSCTPSGSGINMSSACDWQYSVSNATSEQTRQGDPYSWVCMSG